MLIVCFLHQNLQDRYHGFVIQNVSFEYNLIQGENIRGFEIQEIDLDVKNRFQWGLFSIREWMNDLRLLVKQYYNIEISMEEY